MRKRISWKINDLVGIKLDVNLYTIAQLLVEPYIMFFNSTRSADEWNNIDLEKTETIFCLAVSRKVIQKLVSSKIRSINVKPAKIQIPPFWISPHVNYNGNGYHFKGGKLIKIDPEIGSSYQAITVKKNLLLPEDVEIIKDFELINMWDADNLLIRLTNYFEMGVTDDPLKEKIFEGYKSFL